MNPRFTPGTKVALRSAKHQQNRDINIMDVGVIKSVNGMNQGIVELSWTTIPFLLSDGSGRFPDEDPDTGERTYFFLDPDYTLAQANHSLLRRDLERAQRNAKELLSDLDYLLDQPTQPTNTELNSLNTTAQELANGMDSALKDHQERTEGIFDTPEAVFSAVIRNVHEDTLHALDTDVTAFERIETEGVVGVIFDARFGVSQGVVESARISLTPNTKDASLRMEVVFYEDEAFNRIYPQVTLERLDSILCSLID